METGKKISVIVPMYNAERYIGKCLESVVRQTYPELEILVIDDGSVDKGPGICGKLAERDGRIQVLRQENQGVSDARNTGLDRACGEYVFFLDSDDAIHPRLLEEMLGRAEGWGAQLAFCGYARMDGRELEESLKRDWGEEARKAGGQGGEQVGSEADAIREADARRPGKRAAAGEAPIGEDSAATRWHTADEEMTENWFHVKYTDIFSGIGGKLILRSAIGDVRFDRSLANGEDTWFLYRLTDRQVKSVCCGNAWYYYRVHPESVTNSAGTARGRRYFDCARRIRDGEYRKGRRDYAMRWEIVLAEQLKRSYESLRRGGEREAAADLRKTAVSEAGHPLFGEICLSDRILFRCCFCCHPIYVILDRLIHILVKERSR
ncbi:glycosyltransferase family 2 protein [uncultured Acetatifactor sp.]|uniref:glycosyltransferase family 2 protein n=2 Tax=uncultured Acetatifactor sp. TaxID=1671927 RepID=UPI00261E809C|nr:glycosyltransferase family 2 protein [uncultured Acetatifactor sp.]